MHDPRVGALSRWPRARRVGRALLCVWIPLSIGVIALLMASHVVALPTPTARAVEAALAHSREGKPEGRAVFRAYHVLYADCPCSRRVAESLVGRGALPHLEEVVLLVGHDEALARRLVVRGFSMEELTPDALHVRFGVEAAPMFFATGPDATVRYLGGYSGFKQGPEQDVSILDRVRLGARPAPLPLFGCAVSRELQGKADPAGIKGMLTALQRVTVMPR